MTASINEDHEGMDQVVEDLHDYIHIRDTITIYAQSKAVSWANYAALNRAIAFGEESGSAVIVGRWEIIKAVGRFYKSL